MHRYTKVLSKVTSLVPRPHPASNVQHWKVGGAWGRGYKVTPSYTNPRGKPPLPTQAHLIPRPLRGGGGLWFEEGPRDGSEATPKYAKSNTYMYNCVTITS